MFHHRSSKFDPRISAIAGHLRAIEKELGGIGQSAGRRASTGGMVTLHLRREPRLVPTSGAPC
jgi:hypothetical protein